MYQKAGMIFPGEFVAYFLYFLQLPQLTEITSLFLIFLSIYLIYLRYKKETDNISFIFQLLILSTLFGSKVGDYHLLALLVPIIYLLNNYPINSKLIQLNSYVIVSYCAKTSCYSNVFCKLRSY